MDYILNLIFGRPKGLSLKINDWSIKYCEQNSRPIYGIGFILHLLPEYESEIEKKSKTAAQMRKAKEEMKKLNDEIQRQEILMQKYNPLN